MTSQQAPTGAGRSRRRASPPSIKRRITLNVAILLIAVLGLMAAASTIALRTILDRQLAAQLSSGAERARALILARTSPTTTEAQLRAATPARSFVVCLSAAEDVISSTAPPDLALGELMERVRRAGPRQLVSFDSDSGPVRAVLVPLDVEEPLVLSLDGRTEAVSALIIGFDTSAAERVVQRTALLELALTLAAGATILLLLPVTLDRGIRPLRGMTEAARAVAAGEVGRRLPADAQAAETVILAQAVNDALDARQEAEARLRQFVADASHELRTPLTTIEGWAELHREGGLADPELMDRAMNRIAESAAHLTALVEDLALLARLDAGRPVERVPVDLAVLTEAVVDDIRVIDSTRAVTTSMPAPGTSAVVVGDEQRLRQVVLNLTGNALQHTPAGTAVAVGLERQDDLVVLTVCDAGPGIAPEHQSRIFDRFYRVGHGRSTGGTGLGLAIVRSLVEAHGGTVAVTSAPGRTCFTVAIRASTHQPVPHPPS